MKNHEILSHYFSSGLIQDIESVSSEMNVPSGTQILDTGTQINVIPFVTSGSIKVYKEDDSGREILLYYLEAGDTCAMTLNSCIANEKSKIKAVAEEDSILLLIPSDQLLKWIDRFPEMKHFLIKVYNQRFSNLLTTIDSLAFHNLDERIIDYLKKIATRTGNHDISITHQMIANELGSTREGISRVLKQMEQKGKVRLSRNKVTIF